MSGNTSSSSVRHHPEPQHPPDLSKSGREMRREQKQGKERVSRNVEKKEKIHDFTFLDQNHVTDT